MNSINQFFSEIPANTLAIASLGILAKSSLLLLCAWAVVALQRRRSAAVRHMMWTLAISCSLALLALQVALPAWKVLPRIDKAQETVPTAQPQPAAENILALTAEDSATAPRTATTATKKPTKNVKLTTAAGP